MTVDRQETKLERERGDGIGKVCEPGLEHGMPEAQRATSRRAAHRTISADKDLTS